MPPKTFLAVNHDDRYALVIAGRQLGVFVNIDESWYKLTSCEELVSFFA